MTPNCSRNFQQVWGFSKRNEFVDVLKEVWEWGRGGGVKCLLWLFLQPHSRRTASLLNVFFLFILF